MCGAEPAKSPAVWFDLYVALEALSNLQRRQPDQPIGDTPMRNTQIVAGATMLVLLAAALPSYAADAAAGQKVFKSVCAACHQLKDKYYTGKSEAALETALKSIVAGKIKHEKELTLSDTDIANIATYISSGNPK
jgi:mono/diheme cytochrome c family protein